MTFYNFFGTFSHVKKFFQQVFRFEYLCAIFVSWNDHCYSIVLTDENPLLQSLFCRIYFLKKTIFP